MEGYLVLENGEVFKGIKIGKKDNIVVNVVHNNIKKGIVELITNPTTLGQGIVLNTSYLFLEKIDKQKFQSDYVCASSIITEKIIGNEEILNNFCEQNGIVILKNIDTQKLISSLEKNGEMLGMIVSNCENIKEIIDKIKKYNVQIDLQNIMVDRIYAYGKSKPKSIGIIDFGFKHGLVNDFLKKDIGVSIYTYDTPIERIITAKHNGIVLSDGPENINIDEKEKVINLIQKLTRIKLPILCIGKGHRLMCEANEIKLKTLKKGKRGVNFFVKDTLNEKLYVTTQNTKYYIDEKLIQNENIIVRFKDLKDETVTGIEYKLKPIISVEFDITGMPGSLDGNQILDEFIEKL